METPKFVIKPSRRVFPDEHRSDRQDRGTRRGKAIWTRPHLSPSTDLGFHGYKAFVGRDWLAHPMARLAAPMAGLQWKHGWRGDTHRSIEPSPSRMSNRRTWRITRGARVAASSTTIRSGAGTLNPCLANADSEGGIIASQRGSRSQTSWKRAWTRVPAVSTRNPGPGEGHTVLVSVIEVGDAVLRFQGRAWQV